MAGLVPAIHVLAVVPRKGVDPRGKPEDDGGWGCAFKRVMAGLVPAIASLAVVPRKGVDPRGKPEDDGGWDAHSSASWPGLSGPSTSLAVVPGKAWILGASPRMTVDGDAHSSASWPGLSRTWRRAKGVLGKSDDGEGMRSAIRSVGKPRRRRAQEGDPEAGSAAPSSASWPGLSRPSTSWRSAQERRGSSGQARG